MYTYSVKTEKNFLGALETHKVSIVSEIMAMIDQLKVQAFFAVEISPPIDSIDMIQVMLQANTKGIFKKIPIPPEYTMDIVVKDDAGEDKLWYMSDTMNYDDVQTILTNFIERQELPNYESWLDATKDMIRN